MSDARRYPRSLKGSRPSVPHGTNFFNYFILCMHCQYFSCFKLRLTTFVKRILIDWLIISQKHQFTKRMLWKVAGAKSKHLRSTHTSCTGVTVGRLLRFSVGFRYDLGVYNYTIWSTITIRLRRFFAQLRNLPVCVSVNNSSFSSFCVLIYKHLHQSAFQCRLTWSLTVFIILGLLYCVQEKSNPPPPRQYTIDMSNLNYIDKIMHTYFWIYPWKNYQISWEHIIW